MKRPKRLNYPNGIYGDISYTKQLNKYITYLENKNKALQLQQTGVNIQVDEAEIQKIQPDLNPYSPTANWIKPKP